MKHLLLTTIAAVVLVGGGPSVDIHQAAEEGNIEAVKQAIAASSDVNKKDRYENTPLLHAASSGHKEIVELLISNGANVNAKGDLGTTPLLWAAVRGRKEVAELFLAKGADVNAQMDDGTTPLDWADGEIADLLRKHGGKAGEELKAEGK